MVLVNLMLLGDFDPVLVVMPAPAHPPSGHGVEELQRELVREHLHCLPHHVSLPIPTPAATTYPLLPTPLVHPLPPTPLAHPLPPPTCTYACTGRGGAGHRRALHSKHCPNSRSGGARPRRSSAPFRGVCLYSDPQRGAVQNAADTPRTLCGTPSTLCGTPRTLCVTPRTLCGTPSTLCVTPRTLCGTPSTLCG